MLVKYLHNKFAVQTINHVFKIVIKLMVQNGEKNGKHILATVKEQYMQRNHVVTIKQHIIFSKLKMLHFPQH